MSVTRRNFLAASALTAGLAGLTACGGSGTTDGDASSSAAAAASDAFAAPDASAYPIDPDGDDVEPKFTTETLRKDSWTRATNPDGGAEIGVMDEARIIQVDGYAFRDMNGDGKLELWEDWRQTPEARAEALAAELSADEILPLMFHDGLSSSSAPLDDDSKTKLSEGLRAGVSRASANADNYVEAINWQNAVQQWCEENDPNGIPYMNSTDPYQLYNIPDNHCLVSAFDPELWKKSGHFTGRAWRATGVRVNLGPQIDVHSNILCTRLGGGICEDPATNRDYVSAFGGGMQSTWGDDDCTEDEGWGKDSIAIMCKHYVGAGAVEGGRNDHYDAGKYNVFPSDNFNAQLIPFLDGGLNLESSTGQMAAVMPNYGIAYDEDEQWGENVGGAYNKRNIGILRNAGWDGMVTTDWQILQESNGPRVFGVENLTVEERFKKLLEASVDQLGGDWEPQIAKDGYALYEEEYGADEALARVRDSARRIFTVMNKVQLFDNPYYDREYAAEVLESEAATEFATEASNKSIVMLKNAGGVISSSGVGDKPACYIPSKTSGGGGGGFAMMFGNDGGGETTTTTSLIVDEDMASDVFTVVTDTITEDADGNKSVTELTAEELAATGVEYVLYKMEGPSTGDGTDGLMLAPGEVRETPTEYFPISLQYREYSAETARDPSLAGDILEDGTKENRSYRGHTVTASNESDLDRLLAIREALPDAKIILIIEAGNNAQCFHEFESAVDVIFWSWSMGGRSFGPAYGRILKGEVEPSALLPCQMPASMEAVESSLEDVPRDVECYVDADGNAYDFCFGLNWSGVIDDDRVATYGAAALTDPETEVIPG